MHRVPVSAFGAPDLWGACLINDVRQAIARACLQPRRLTLFTTTTGSAMAAKTLKLDNRLPMWPRYMLPSAAAAAAISQEPHAINDIEWKLL